MRLVDIDEFENNTVSKFERNNNFEYRDMVKSIIFSIFQDLDKQSTTYDTDKVIEQLEETFDKWGLDEGKKEIMRDIVRKGSKE